jgi:ribonuclease P protein component
MRHGRRRAHPDLVVLTLDRSIKPNGNSGLSVYQEGVRRRLGITASRKVGNSVCRNRFKRRVREWFRERRGELDPAVDLVVIARRSGAELSLQDLDGRLSSLLGLDPVER